MYYVLNRITRGEFVFPEEVDKSVSNWFITYNGLVLTPDLDFTLQGNKIIIPVSKEVGMSTDKVVLHTILERKVRK